MLYCIYALGHWLAKVSAAPTELIILLYSDPQGFISGFALIPPWAMQECRPFRALCTLFLFPQDFISGFALIPPWAMQECRPFRALCRIGCVYPGFHIGLCPHCTLGYAGVSPFQGSLSYWLCAPRVSYRALPSFYLGLCRSAALSGLIVVLAVCTQGFISGFALISSWAMQECCPFRGQ